MAGQDVISGWARWLAMVLLAMATAAPLGAAPALEDLAAGVRIDRGQISVSGISSGGFMAHQFHVAHSEHLVGAGIVAGGPYYCARGRMLDAISRCSRFVERECLALGISPEWCGKTDRAPKNRREIEAAAQAAFSEARAQETAGTISPLANLQDDRIYLFSGVYDDIVPNAVMATVFRFYADADKGAVRQGNIDFSGTFPARHTMVRDSFGKPPGKVVGDCPLPPAAPPPAASDAYIDDCQAVAREHEKKNHCLCPPPAAGAVDGAISCPPADKRALCKDLRDVDLAGAILERIYGAQALRNGRVPVQEDELQAFDQRQVFAGFSDTPYSALQDASMAREGYILVPQTCRDGRQCRLHVVFHGCRQGGTTDQRPGHTGNLFAKYAGYNEWAKANDVIVLYPQIQARSLGPINPRGCWDWWGQNYTHAGYHTQEGTQIKAVAQMINLLAGGESLLTVRRQ